MTQSPNKAPDDNPDADKQQASGQDKRKAKRREKLKFYGSVALAVLMGIIFIGFIFRPDKEKEAEGVSGFNYSVPDASVQDTQGDKRKALEQAETEGQQQARVRNLVDFGDTFGQSGPQTEVPKFTDSVPQVSSRVSDDPIRQSQQTAVRLNEQLRTFYDEPKEDPRVARLQRQVEELTELVQHQQQVGAATQTVDEVALLEKSFEMASRYMPGQAGVAVVDSTRADTGRPREVADARRADHNPVSSLTEPSGERNIGFMTAVGQQAVSLSNSIRACVDQDQTVTAGAQVRLRLRLLEPLRVGGNLIPVNAPVYGNARIEGQRLSLVVTSIESEGSIIPVELTVHDMDGQRGLNIPNTMERTAAKEALASIGQGFGSSISFARDAGQQVAMDLTRGAMNGASQYLSAKMREVKISLKAGYQVLLIAKQ